MRIKKGNQPMQKILNYYINHSLSREILKTMQQCDQVQNLLNERKFKLALKLILSLISNLKFSNIKEQVCDLAIIALDELIDNYHNQKNFKKVLEYLDKWIRLRPSDLYPLILKGEILYLEMEDLKTAYQTFRQVVKLAPNCLEAWIYLANIEYHRGHYRRAALFLIKAWQSLNDVQWGYPMTSSVATNILESLYGTTAALLIAFGDKKGAKAIITKGIKVIGNHSEYLNKILQWIKS